MTPRLINPRQILQGDEIVVAGNQLRYFKVLADPKEGKRELYAYLADGNNDFGWQKTGKKALSSFRCTTSQERVEYKTRNGGTSYYTKNIFEMDSSKHNVKVSINLEGKDVLLIKRKGEQYVEHT